MTHSDLSLPIYAKDRVRSITREVEDLHPILERLFRAMGFQAVENTHGPSEHGADFVLTEYDARVESIKYIGVIAKTTKILSNTTAIENQIRQCSSRRFIEGGKKEIRISTIYVVTTQNISHNAQRSLYEGYATSNIEFFDTDRLAGMINKYMPDFWYDIPTELGEYLADLRARNEESDKSFSIVQKHDIDYIQQEVIKYNDDFYSTKSRGSFHRKDVVNIDIEVLEQKFILIEGNIGSGKSKLLRKIVARYSDPEEYKTSGVIPVFINFRDFYDQFSCDLIALVDSVMQNVKRGLNLDEKILLILIDGFDEKILDYTSRLEIIDQIRKLCIHKRVHVVLSSRHLFSHINTPNSLKQIARYEIAPLSTKKLITYIEKLCTSLNIHKRLIEDIKKSHLLRGIPRSPIAATILAQLLRETGQDLPSNLTELYAKYIDLVLGRWDIQKGIKSQRDYEITENVLTGVT